MKFNTWQLERIIALGRPHYDDLPRSLASELLDARERIAELEEKLQASEAQALQYAQTGASINLAWILNLDKVAELASGGLHKDTVALVENVAERAKEEQ